MGENWNILGEKRYVQSTVSTLYVHYSRRV